MVKPPVTTSKPAPPAGGSVASPSTNVIFGDDGVPNSLGGVAVV